MMQSIVFKSLAVMLAAFTLGGTAFALGGCVNSPENPTWILAGIGTVAAGVPWLRSRLKCRRNRNDK